MKKENDFIKWIIIVIVSILIILFTYNDDFLYTNKIIKVSKIDVKNEEVLKNNLGLKETHKELIIYGTVTNGKNKGKLEKYEYEELSSSIITNKYKVGDKLIIKNNEIDTLKRDVYLVSLILLFIISLYLVSNYKGLLALVSVILNISIFYIGLLLYFKGFNLFFLCLLESIIFTVLSLFLAAGNNKKTYSAIISVFITTLIVILLTVIIGSITKYKGISFNNLEFLTVPINDVFLSMLIIGGLGAIMDVCITISSSINELVCNNKKISTKELIKSSNEIGIDIMGTMINVLFFTYLCGELPIFVLAIRNGVTVYNTIKIFFSLGITRFLIGSIGIALAIPISQFISIKMIKRGDRYE